MRLGIDFDNTLICYDKVLLQQAQKWGFIKSTQLDCQDEGPSLKKKIRDLIRQSCHGDEGWQLLQSYIYGKGINQATAFPGVLDFIDHCKLKNFTIYIVSHKTEFAVRDPEKIPLRPAALGWLESNAFIHEQRIPRKNIFFENTLEQKIQRINDLNLNYFIDDLEEVLTHKNFPSQTQKILMGQPAGVYHQQNNSFPGFSNFQELAEFLSL